MSLFLLQKPFLPRSGIKFELTIEKIVPHGYGIGRAGGKMVFVPFTIPGERVIVEPKEERPHYTVASLVEILSSSPFRVDPPCPYFGDCGGCQMQHTSYTAQLEAKISILTDSFKRIAKQDISEFLDPSDGNNETCIEGFGRELHYRNKTSLAYDARGNAGFYASQSRRVVPVEYCLQMPKGWNENCLPWLRHRSSLSKAVSRVGTEGDVHVALQACKGKVREIREMLKREISYGNSPFWNACGIEVNGNLVWGSRFIQTNMLGKIMRVGSESFFQTNYGAATEMVLKIEKYLESDPGDTLADLYAGCGFFSIFLSPHFDRVLAIEMEKSSVDDFRFNIWANHIENVRVIEGNVERAIGAIGQVQTVIADPPRTGMGKLALKEILELKARKIIYVSCDPPTLARDCRVFLEAGYRIRGITLIDMFPQTAHVEALVFFAR